MRLLKPKIVFVTTIERVVQMVVIIIITVGLSWYIGERIAAKSNVTEQRACHRLNIHRVEQDDVNWYREWQFDRFFLQAIIHPLPGGPKPTRAQEAQRLQAAKYLKGIVNSLTWIPATKDCPNAKGSAPVRFIVRQPTEHDLTLEPGE